jgi:hypothetical protein
MRRPPIVALVALGLCLSLLAASGHSASESPEKGRIYSSP